MSTPQKIVGWGAIIVGIAGMGYILIHAFYTTRSSNASPPVTPVVIVVKIVNKPKTVGAYVPAAITIRGNRNESIEFKNASTAVHTVTDVHGRFNTGKIPVGGTATLTLSAPGLYHYHCTLHPGMSGTINVLLKRQPRRTT